VSANSLLIAGIDEVGRGPLAGPVVASAVILDPKRPIAGLADSKKLSEKKRDALSTLILANAISVGMGIVSPAQIDELNILQATFLAMKQAFQSLSVKPGEIWVDGNQRIPGLELSQKTFVGGDALHECIMAASIVAKVHRDRLMMDYALQYPSYGFDKHKGYGTAVHLEALRAHGPCDIHRLSFAPCSNS
jgi:ribonuclease HII